VVRPGLHSVPARSPLTGARKKLYGFLYGTSTKHTHIRYQLIGTSINDVQSEQHDLFEPHFALL
jgi:hypothetical protein